MMAILENITIVVLAVMIGGTWLLGLGLDEFAELFGKFLMFAVAVSAFFLFFLLRRWW